MHPISINTFEVLMHVTIHTNLLLVNVFFVTVFLYQECYQFKGVSCLQRLKGFLWEICQFFDEYISVMASVHNVVTISCEYHVTAWMFYVIFKFTFCIYTDIYYDLLITVTHTLFVWVWRRKYYGQRIVFSSQYFSLFFPFFIYIYFPILLLHFWKAFTIFSPMFFNKSPGKPRRFPRNFQNPPSNGVSSHFTVELFNSVVSPIFSSFFPHPTLF